VNINLLLSQLEKMVKVVLIGIEHRDLGAKEYSLLLVKELATNLKT